MGCASSKLDDLPAVALCRERCAFLDEAIHQRYALAEAHVAYVHSLKVVGHCLHRFFDRDLDDSAAPSAIVLDLPTQRKGDAGPSASPPPEVVHDLQSNSGSHLHFHSDSDEEDSGSESLHLHQHLDSDSPVHPYGQINYDDSQEMNSYPPGGGFVHMNYMKNQTTPSVLYEQRPMSPETVHVGESSSSSYNPYPYSNQNPSTSYSYYNYPNYGAFFGSSSPPQPYGSAYPPPEVGPSFSAASSSKQPPPPPSPPRASGWEFLNPFESFERYYPSYTPSRNSREVREEEGIPDLEDEDYQQEVVKEVHGDQKFVNNKGEANYSKEAVDNEEAKAKAKSKVIANDSESLVHDMPSASSDNEPVEYEVHMVEKKVADNKGDRGNVSGSKSRGNLHNDSDVLREIQVQFERASESGNEVAALLEVGKLPHNRKHAAYQASKMLHAITASQSVVSSSQASTSKSAESLSIEKAGPAMLDIDDDLGLRSRNLSSTLHKLYLWEKKLYEEVKVEEKLRVLHERKVRKLKHLDEKGAEAHKVEATRTLVRSLSTKIRIAIQVVDKISVKINKLRDEDLWPQLNKFIQGLTRMWKSMLECHRAQCHAIGEAKRLDAVASSTKHSSDAHLEATLQLEHELLNWILRFSCWISTQKGYIRALNNWLLKCLLYVPEETPDGVVPFSPSRIGAPPVFGVCNQWSQALDRISEKEVVDSMRDFATSVLQLWERDKVELRQRMMANRDMERKVKSLEREDYKIQKEIQALDKRMVLVSGDGSGLSLSGQVVFQGDTSKSGNLQVSLQHIFEAMERFTASNLRAYEELLQRIEEDRLVQEQEKAS